jgi:hypothetical protein
MAWFLCGMTTQDRAFALGRRGTWQPNPRWEHQSIYHANPREPAERPEEMTRKPLYSGAYWIFDR